MPRETDTKLITLQNHYGLWTEKLKNVEHIFVD